MMANEEHDRACLEQRCVAIDECRPWMRGIAIPDDPEVVDVVGRHIIERHAKEEYRARVLGIHPAMSPDEVLDRIRSTPDDIPGCSSLPPRAGYAWGNWTPGGNRASTSTHSVASWADEFYCRGADELGWLDLLEAYRLRLPQLPAARLDELHRAFFRVMKSGARPSDERRYSFPGNVHPEVRVIEPNAFYRVPPRGVFSEVGANPPEVVRPFLPHGVIRA